MPITRRALLTSVLFAGFVPTSRALALSGEPFPVSESEAQMVDYKFRRREVEYKTQEPAGTIVVDPKHRFLHLERSESRLNRIRIPKSAVL